LSENLSNSRIRLDRQNFFLNIDKIVGAQSISINQNIGAYPLRYLGMSTNRIFQVPRNGASPDASIDVFLVNSDPWFDLVTGTLLANFFILKDQTNPADNYCLISGWANSFNCKYNFGQLPQISTSWNFINVGAINTGALSTHTYNQLTTIQTGNFTGAVNPIIPDSASISVNTLDFTSNRITSFEISVNANKIPIYNVGMRKPARIETIYPMDVLATFTADLGIYPFTGATTFPQFQKIENLTILVSGQALTQQIASYSFNNLTLTSQTYSTSVDGNTVITNKYAGHISK
jgi:hypothetical protein